VRRQRLATHLGRLEVHAEQALDRRVEPQELLDRRGDQAGVGPQRHEQLGLQDQPVQHERQQAGRGLVAGHEQLLGEPSHLAV
jgi:hypothetical protein